MLTCDFRASDKSSDCRFLRETRSSGSNTAGSGAGGGGPGAVACGTGLAELTIEECIRRTLRLLNLPNCLVIPKTGRIAAIFNVLELYAIQA